MFSFLKKIIGWNKGKNKQDPNESDMEKPTESIPRENVAQHSVENDIGTESLSLEFQYMRSLIQYRLKQYFQTDDQRNPPVIPEIATWSLHIPKSFLESQLDDAEKVLLLLTICPHVYGDLFDHVIQENLPREGDFPQLGGTRGKSFRGFLPTGETALFLLAAASSQKRKEIQKLFDPDSFLPRNRILWLEEVPEGEPRLSGRIIMSQEYVDLLTRGKITRPAFSLRFPAQRVETAFTWEDLVLNEETMDQVKELKTWLAYGNTILDHWDMRKKLKPGYRVLFHGTPGTGKTLTASLLGKYTGKEVYKIDLSMVVSKFIGETEKNLANLFTKAENKNWILFFDEADALFGKRTNVRDAHDKYANQEVSYLLQRVEDYNGLVILASNFKSNIDDAFIRRFQSVINFPFPKANERYQLWEKAFPAKIAFSKDVQLRVIADKYELTGAQIMNIVQFCCLRALDRNSTKIGIQDIHSGIQKEYLKERKIMR